MTDGFEVLVQLVMAAIATEPSVICVSYRRSGPPHLWAQMATSTFSRALGSKQGFSSHSLSLRRFHPWGP